MNDNTIFQDRANPQPLSLTRQWYTLREACELKGLNYHSVLNKPFLKPHAGTRIDAVVGGRNVYSVSTVREWLLEDDLTLARMSKKEEKKEQNYEERRTI